MNMSYRKPTAADGLAVHGLIKRCPPLDQNSLYCNLLQCTDFSTTSIIAEDDQHRVIGFISGYIPPERVETLFIWQVALDPDFRGLGIASRMLSQLFERNDQHKCMETTISPSNLASQKLFENFFEARQMNFETRVLFEKGVHLDSCHESEVLYRAEPKKRLSTVQAG